MSIAFHCPVRQRHPPLALFPEPCIPSSWIWEGIPCSAIRWIGRLCRTCADPLVVCNEEHRFYVAAALQQKGVSEPFCWSPRDGIPRPPLRWRRSRRCPAGDPLLLVLPSDHVLKPQDVRRSRGAARACAESGRIVTFGITPGCTETGFGLYPPGWGALGRVLWRFVENRISPEPRPCWRTEGIRNSGMFLFPRIHLS